MSEFKSLSDLIIALGNFEKKNIPDPRLSKTLDGKIVVKAPTGQCEVVSADGGYLVSGEIVTPIARSIAQKSTIFAKATKFYTSTGKGVNSCWMPHLEETHRTNAANQLKCYWVEEGNTKTEAKFTFGLHQKRLNKIFGVVSITEELWDDSVALQQAIEQWVGSKDNGSLLWYIEYAMLYGSFATSMEGIFSAGAVGTIGVATANPLDEATLELYVSALAPASMPTSAWYMSKENWNDILTITWNNPNVMTFANGQMYLYGIPVFVLEQMSGSSQDIVLGDWSQYGVALREGPLVESAMSIHIKFLTDEKTIRMGVRINGASFGSTFDLDDGVTVGSFVIPAGAPSVESSSSSSFGLTSSSSSEDITSASSNSSSSKSTDSSSSTDMSESSSSSKSVSSVSSSSSQSGEGTCPENLCGSGFSIPELNGNYQVNGQYNSEPAWQHSSGVIWIWYDSTSTYWVMSNNKGDPQNQWASTTDTDGQTCPSDDIWVDDDGVVSAGKC